MKLVTDFAKLLVGGMAIGIGIEVGRIQIGVVAKLLSKKTREEFKAEYNRRMQKQPGIRLVTPDKVDEGDWARWSKTLNDQNNKPGEKA